MFAPCSKKFAVTSSADNGTYSVSARAADAAGNAGMATGSFTVSLPVPSGGGGGVRLGGCRPGAGGEGRDRQGPGRDNDRATGWGDPRRGDGDDHPLLAEVAGWLQQDLSGNDSFQRAPEFSPGLFVCACAQQSLCLLAGGSPAGVRAKPPRS